MTTPLVVVPDVTKALIGYYADHGAVAPLITPAGAGAEPNVSTVLGPPYPMLRVFRTGGTARRKLDTAAIHIEAWGAPDTDMEAELTQLARVALAATHQLPGTQIPGMGVSWVRDLVVMQWLPDDQTQQQRYLHSVLINCSALD